MAFGECDPDWVRARVRVRVELVTDIDGIVED